MTIFNLPDLGEGLPEAEIHEWFVKEGDEVKKDQAIVAMETAKAVVEVPAPQSGIIKKLYGQTGTLIKTGQPLMEFESIEKTTSSTVVGELQEHAEVKLSHIQAASPSNTLPKASFAVKRLALQLGVALEEIVGSDEFGVITAKDVENHAKNHAKAPTSQNITGVRRQMLKTMELSHQQVVPVSIYDQADISHWTKPYDITVRLIQAICVAVKKEPSLNAWFNGTALEIVPEVHLGLAVDSAEGLFVPVIHHAHTMNAQQLRQEIETCKIGVEKRSLAPEAFQKGTIILSNFGRFAGRYANPIIVPPMVAIIAVGRLFDEVVATSDGFAAHKQLPISLTFDHRPLTGGEATRFLGEIIKQLQE